MKQSQRSKAVVRVGALAALALTMAMAASPTQAWYAWSAWTLNANNPATCTNGGGSVEGNSVGDSTGVAAWSPTFFGWRTEAQAYPSLNTVIVYASNNGWKQTSWVSAPNTTQTRCRIENTVQ